VRAISTGEGSAERLLRNAYAAPLAEADAVPSVTAWPRVRMRYRAIKYWLSTAAVVVAMT
jgi:hypothetical protein